MCSVDEANTSSGLQSTGCVVLISRYGKGNKLPVMLFITFSYRCGFLETYMYLGLFRFVSRKTLQYDAWSSVRTEHHDNHHYGNGKGHRS